MEVYVVNVVKMSILGYITFRVLAKIIIPLPDNGSKIVIESRII